MFMNLINNKGKAVIVTDETALAEAIRKVALNEYVPVYFTRGPDEACVKGLAEGLNDTFPVRAITTKDKEGWTVMVWLGTDRTNKVWDQMWDDEEVKFLRSVANDKIYQVSGVKPKTVSHNLQAFDLKSLANHLFKVMDMSKLSDADLDMVSQIRPRLEKAAEEYQA